VQREVLGLTLSNHAALEALLRGYNQAYNLRRQRVLQGRSPAQVAAERLRTRPELANADCRPSDSSALATAMAVVEAGKEGVATRHGRNSAASQSGRVVALHKLRPAHRGEECDVARHVVLCLGPGRGGRIARRTTTTKSHEEAGSEEGGQEGQRERSHHPGAGAEGSWGRATQRRAGGRRPGVYAAPRGSTRGAGPGPDAPSPPPRPRPYLRACSCRASPDSSARA
jgi:hypothetical protein